MNRYDHYTDSFISDDVDLRSYMLGYLQGCSDSLNKFKGMYMIPTYTIPLDSNSKEYLEKSPEV